MPKRAGTTQVCIESALQSFARDAKESWNYVNIHRISSVSLPKDMPKRAGTTQIGIESALQASKNAGTTVFYVLF